MPTTAIDLDHVALAASDTTPLLHFLTGTVNATVLWGGQQFGFRPMQVLAGDAALGMRIELLEPWEVEHNDFLARFLAQRGPGPHHMTFKVPDIEAALARARALGFEPVNVDLSRAEWKEAFLHPRQSHGTVVQIAESHDNHGSRAELLEMARRADPAEQGRPRWWADPLLPSGPPRYLVRVVVAVPDLAPAAAMYRELLDGETVEAGDVACELAWPGGGRIRLERRAGRAAVDRLEIEGLDRDYEVLGTRFTPARD
jgi:catechol 2,3-dioxygenase-like lactoylglutathione lyase family enzyme